VTSLEAVSRDEAIAHMVQARGPGQEIRIMDAQEFSFDGVMGATGASRVGTITLSHDQWLEK
jgi:hypothetical protein